METSLTPFVYQYGQYLGCWFFFVSFFSFMQSAMEVQTVCVCRSWLLYVERRYQGSCVLLEEGQTIQTSGETRERDGPSAPALLSVGSIRRAVKVYLSNRLFLLLFSTSVYSCLLYPNEPSGSFDASDIHFLSNQKRTP